MADDPEFLLASELSLNTEFGNIDWRNAMTHSKGVIISVKVPIKWEVMTKRTRQRLRQIVGRDTRVIRSFLGIIEQCENQLLTGRKRNRINDGDLEKLTLTALKVKAGFSQRPSVPHDMKARFTRISTNELQECRNTAVSIYEGYLELRRKKGTQSISTMCSEWNSKDSKMGICSEI
jgi:hypothetical protein